ncbi:MAG TPA: hypothetical protein VL128_02255 [Candidatus Eisenbacteria bacterium]|nr:hypothetical protein [Candidatus Eisenbacteria bacterium]
MLKQLWNTSAPLTFTGLLMLPLLAFAIAGLFIDPRIITDAPAWLKPAKFVVSIAIYVFTLAWAFTLIPGWRKTRLVVGWATSIAMVLEFMIIALQAYRGTTSHFNFSTPLNSVLFIIMGVAIVLQTFISITVAVAFWRQRFEDPAMGWALRFGMIITIIGALSAGFMTHPTAVQLAAAHGGQAMPIMGAHTVGAPDGGPGLPGTGWSTEHGDLRIPHFIGLHALQVLPLIAFVVRRPRLSSDTRVRLTLTAAGSYFTLVVLLLVQALRGQPILRPDALTFGLFGAWALATAIYGWNTFNPASAVTTPETS